MRRNRAGRYQTLRKPIIVVGLLALWEAGVRLSGISPILLPAPSAVLLEMGRGFRDGSLLLHTWATVENLLVAMVIGIVLAVALNLLAFSSRWGLDILMTITAALNPLPAIAMLPLALIWLGVGRSSLIFVLVNSVVWAMVLNMYMGFATVPATLRAVGANLGLEGTRLFWHVLVPAALPHILTGVKVSWAFGWRTAIAAELVFGATSSGRGGLGWMIFRERYNLNSAGVFAGLLMIVLIGLLVEAGFQAVEQRTVHRWGMSL